ncbi:putative quinol monooxygenase [Psychrilyobacter atlanticus]|uniref:putative quinol monooxygenase n=1 Tax=Psychrilyobacter atlanticus TaxID=271091 RepID=UPI00040B0270|nr:putative quinol monooxygenase [Psychrilyobacter atlanticus]
MIAMVVKIITETNDIQRIKEVAEKLVVETKKEKGCIEYDLYINIEDKTSMSFIEKWETKDDLENHLNSEHFKRLYPEICKYKIDGETVLYEKHSV